MRESQRVIAATKPIAFTLEAILVVADVLADAMPGELFWPISCRLREAEHAHAIVVEGVWLGEVQDVELDREILASVANFEEELLRVPVCVYIILKHQIVLSLTHFHRSEQIARLEPRLKDQSLIIHAIRHVVRVWGHV